MKTIPLYVLSAAWCVWSVLSTASADPVDADAAAQSSEASQPKVDKTSKPTVDDSHRVSIEAARERAALMHKMYAATLDVMHHRYFHGDRAVVPARAMEDVFKEMERTSHTKANWISINLKAMSIDHEPETAFEKRAARELGSEKAVIDVVEDGYYRQARTIPLTSGCISCHGGFFKKPSEKAKFSGLVISVPVHESK
ncbi:c-type heme family protein [Fuerstiella marisgermanici]|uniref:Tll0287-like domain-containing protein n=1 Tax=Fuerstiella marisgermanici TaxID=1891926 RepID=A0A1P8WCQ9_9PLAN|nr:DUF3365 domain-containing protein [Fuerstiella marisgermanici]APZ91843.1 hypothetical protein Fuma_01439 [Fuerstiella marisgermanici]